MHKTGLQELCHRRLWKPPEYTTSRDGPDHNPRFRSTVTVGDITFESPSAANSAKEAQGQAAAAALQHFAAEARAAPPPAAPVPSNQISYKTQLQSLMQKRNLDPPVYECLRQGPPHALRFKATVKVNGQVFESPQFFSTLKEAEHSAANVALNSLPLEESKEEELGFYKNLLQELAQKEGFSLPRYKTVMDGASHIPLFSSTVEIEGETFSGDVARNKKQAEMHAAKLAFNKLKERRQSKLPGRFAAPGLKVEEVPLPIYTSTPSEVAMNLTQSKPHPVSKSWIEIEIEKGIGEIEADEDQEEHPSNVIADKYSYATIGSKESIRVNQNHIENNSDPSATPLHKPDIVVRPAKDQENNSPNKIENNSVLSAAHIHKPNIAVKPEKEDPAPEDGTSSPSASSNCLDHKAEVLNAEFPIERNGSSLLCNRVRIYPRKPNLVLPEGCTVLPFSDDMWVAVSLDFSNQGAGVSA